MFASRGGRKRGHRMARKFVRPPCGARHETSAADRSRALGLVVLAPGILAFAAAHAQPALEDVVVTATRHDTGVLETPASVTLVDSEAVALRAPARGGDLLRDVPNVYARGVTIGGSFPGTAQAAIAMRGVPRGMRTLMLVDGMPINNALSGAIDVASIPVSDIERVEVVRGPMSALYGGHAMGGVINYITVIPDEPVNEFRFGLGNMGQHRYGLLLRRRLEPQGWGFSFSWNRRDSDGYPDSDWAVATAAPGAGMPGVTGAVPTQGRDGAPAWLLGFKGERPWNTTQVNLAADRPLVGGGRIRAGVTLSSYDVGYAAPVSFMRNAAGDPLLLGSADVGGGNRVRFTEASFAIPTPSGERDLRVYGQWTQPLANSSEFRTSVSYLRHDFDYMMPNFVLANLSGGPGLSVVQPDHRYDVDANWRFPVARDWFAIVGVAASRAELDRREDSVSSWRDKGSVTGVATLGKGSMTGASVYAQAEWFATPTLTAYFGVRYDRYRTRGRVAQTTDPAFDISYADRSFDAVSPKAALSWRVSSGVSLRASYGTGFRAPSLFDLYSRYASPTAIAGIAQVNEASPDLEAEHIEAFEVGADVAFGQGSQWSVTLYTQRLTDLIHRRTISPVLTHTVNSAEARIDGIEASLRWRPEAQAWRGLTLTGALGYQFRYEITDNPAEPATVGRKLTDVPRTTASIGAEYRQGRFAGLLTYRYTSAVFGSGDDMNQNVAKGVYGVYDAHGSFDMRASWQLNRHVELGLAIDNITDRRWFEFYRQPGRSVMVETVLRF